jgi:Zn-dependent protease with chaperone function
MDDDELRAILAHEAAHVAKYHLQQHMVLSVAIGVLAVVLVSQLAFSGLPVFDVSALVVVVTSFGALRTAVFNAISGRQELDADRWAAALCGPAALITALEELTPPPARSDLLAWSTHPHWDRRRAAIEAVDPRRSCRGA